MATNTRLHNGKFRVQVREKNLKPISRTFQNEQEANAYCARIESDLRSIRDAEKAALPVDMVQLYQSLHPDLKKAVQLLPVFASVLGVVAGSELTLSDLINAFMFQYQRKDKNIVQRLKWWSDQFGHLTSFT